MASAARDALRLVVSPISSALARSMVISPAAASALMPRPSRFRTAPTRDISASKSCPKEKISPAASTMGLVSIAVSPSPPRLFPMPPSAFSAF